MLLFLEGTSQKKLCENMLCIFMCLCIYIHTANICHSIPLYVGKYC